MSLVQTLAHPLAAHPPATATPRRATARRDLADLPLRWRQALDALQQGRPVLLCDDDDRENEADLVVAAERISEASMAMMIRDCAGIVCLCLPGEALEALELPQMVAHNECGHGTAFTVSIDARHGIRTGVSAADRVATVRAAVADGAVPADLVRPGHVFPLLARPGGVLERRGHTEGAVDLARLAGLKPAAVICELMNSDGSMARGEQIARYAEQHGLVTLTIAELVQWRQRAPHEPELNA
jgi:3,4-dihydroxy 2-butanone 4-phosphate synthase